MFKRFLMSFVLGGLFSLPTLAATTPEGYFFMSEVGPTPFEAHENLKWKVWKTCEPMTFLQSSDTKIISQTPERVEVSACFHCVTLEGQDETDLVPPTDCLER